MRKDTKARAIPMAVKLAVAERDSFDGHPCCVYCGTPVPPYNRLAFSCCHVLRRSRGGLGIETNIVTLCPRHHAEFDGGDKGIEAFTHAHMKEKYGESWSIDDQRYRKGSR